MSGVEASVGELLDSEGVSTQHSAGHKGSNLAANAGRELLQQPESVWGYTRRRSGLPLLGRRSSMWTV